MDPFEACRFLESKRPTAYNAAVAAVTTKLVASTKEQRQ